MECYSLRTQRKSLIKTPKILLIIFVFIILTNTGSLNSIGSTIREKEDKIFHSSEESPVDSTIIHSNVSEPEFEDELNYRAFDRNPAFIITLTSPGMNDNENAILENKGAEIEDYLSTTKILITASESSIYDIGNLAFIQAVDKFKAEDKIGGFLASMADKGVSGGSGSKIPVVLTLFDSYDSKASLELTYFKLQEMGFEFELITSSKLRVHAEQSELLKMAGLETVKMLENEPTYHIYNDVAAGIVGAPPVWQTMGYDGSGQIIGIFDLGLDSGVNDNTMHDDIEGRIVNIRNYKGTSPDDKNGHGTHVSGSALGDGTLSGGAYKGIAYGSKLVFQSGGDDTGSISIFPPSVFPSLFQDAYNDGARIHSNSWGEDSKSVYDGRSEDVDEFIWNNNNFTIVFAAGNDGDLANTIGAPGTAKNAITVGATENYRPDNGSGANNISHIYTFSSRGPTNDGRYKPDIMAPGTWILSPRVNKSIVPISSGIFWDEYDGNYAFMGGTSMATPLVAGAAAIVRQYFMEAEGIEPSAALIKAALINGAEDFGTPDIPNNDEGWGRMNLTRTLQPGASGSLLYIDNSSGLNDDEKISFQFDVINDSLPFKVSLVWSDYKGNPNFDGELINDLDLIVENNVAGSYIGNAFSGGWSIVNTTEFDFDNNVECVYIETPEIGRYNVTINASGITNGPQNFALIVTGVLDNASLLPPAGLAVKSEPEGEALNLSWWPNIGDDIARYQIYRSNLTPDNFQFIAEVPHSSSPVYIDYGLENMKEYYYKLKTVNMQSIESSFSEIIKGIPKDTTPPKLIFSNPGNGSKLHGNISLDYTADSDTSMIGFYYYIDSDKDGLANDNHSWIEIGLDNTPTDGFYWDTSATGSGPGDAESVILKAIVQDVNSNNKTVYLTGILVDNTFPSSPVLQSIDGTVVKDPLFSIGAQTEPNATIELFNNGQSTVINKTNATGKFTYTLTLNEGLNNLTAVAFDDVGNGPSAPTLPQFVVLDITSPLADAGGPYSINIGTSFILNASGSHDHEADTHYYFIDNYTWIVTKDILTYYYGKTPRLTLFEFGQYSVTLSIRDAAGNTASTQTEITVGDKLVPDVNAGGNRTVDEDELINFNVLNCSDNDPEFFNNSLFKWQVTTPLNESAFFSGLNLSYLFIHMGVYKITLNVTDAHNNTGVDTIYITARDITPPLAVSGGNRDAVEYHLVEFNAGSSSDNDPTFPGTGQFIWTLAKTGYQDIVLTGISVSYTFIETGVIDMTLTVTDLAGNIDTDKFLVNVIKDLNPPEILGTIPVESAREVSLDVRITCTFSESIKHYLIDNRDFYVTDSNDNVVSGAYSFDEDSFTISFTPNRSIKANEIYYVTLKNTIEDLAGNKMAQDYTWFFSTLTPPLILQFRPEPASTGNSLPDEITVVFNEPILSTSISPEVLKLYDISGNNIDGIIEYDNATFTVSFQPLVGLTYNTEYRVELKNIFFDLQGNRLEDNHTWYFSIGPEPDDPNRFNNLLFLSLIFVILIIIIILVFLIGTGRIKVPGIAGMKGSGRTLPPPPPPPSSPGSKTSRSISKVHKVRKKRAGGRGRFREFSDWDDDEYDDIEDELDADRDDDSEDVYEDESDYEGDDESDEEEDDEDSDDEVDFESSGDIVVDWQDD